MTLLRNATPKELVPGDLFSIPHSSISTHNIVCFCISVIYDKEITFVCLYDSELLWNPGSIFTWQLIHRDHLVIRIF